MASNITKKFAVIEIAAKIAQGVFHWQESNILCQEEINTRVDYFVIPSLQTRVIALYSDEITLKTNRPAYSSVTNIDRVKSFKNTKELDKGGND